MEKIDIVKRVKELNVASEAYYNTGNPIMSDAEFDAKLEELRQWEEESGIVLSNSPTHNVGAVVLDSISKVTHKTPMLSLAKCHSPEEVVKFADNHVLIGSVKMDGLTVRLTYKDGDLIQAESRGNGTIGGLVTEHVKQFLNIPLHINKKGTYIIDGEALIKLDDFAEINKNGKYENSRNLSSGTLSTLDTSVVKDRRLRWYAWEVVEEEEPFDSKSPSFLTRLFEAETLGFDVVPHMVVPVQGADTMKDVIELCLYFAEQEHLPQDGVVFKFDDVLYGKSLGRTTDYFNNGIAYKVENTAYETELINIEYTMGKTGILTPVANFKPIRIEGSTVEKASLHNLSVMKELIGRPWIGQHVGIFKANLIIPNVRWGEKDNGEPKEYIPIPDICPICDQPTKIVKDNDTEVLYCTNPDCKGKLLGKLTHAASRNALNIEGLSESTIEKFISLGWLNSIRDIYYLANYEKKMKTLEGFGPKSVKKLLESIDESRNTDLQRFLYSLSVPLLGKSASMMIAEAVDYDFGLFMQTMTITGAKYFKYIPGIGGVLINSLNDYFSKHCSDIFELSHEFVFNNPKSKLPQSTNTLESKTFVITGSVNHYPNRDALKADIEAHGGKVAGSISSKVSYLINNDITSTSSKNQKAKSLNIPIISEDDFIKMLQK